MQRLLYTSAHIAIWLSMLLVLAALFIVISWGFASHKSFSFQLVTEPAGAEVFLDERYAGRTPCAVKAANNGQHLLRVEKPGYRAKVLSLREVPADRVLRLRLEANLRGTLIVISHPAGAQVYLDGEPRGLTPLTIQDVPEGEHSLHLQKNGYEPHRVAIRVTEPAPLKIECRLVSEVESFLTKAIEAKPDAISHYMELAHHLVLEREFERAGEIFLRGLLTDKKVSETEERPEALAAFRQASARFYQELSNVYWRQYDYGTEEDIPAARQMVEEALSKAIQQAPAYPRFYSVLLQLHLAQGRFADAAQLCEKAVEHMPRAAEFWGQLAFARFKLEQEEAALRASEQALALSNVEPHANYVKGALLRRRGKNSEARECLMIVMKHGSPQLKQLAQQELKPLPH